jgi:hypothetical protein
MAPGGREAFAPAGHRIGPRERIFRALRKLPDQKILPSSLEAKHLSSKRSLRIPATLRVAETGKTGPPIARIPKSVNFDSSEPDRAWGPCYRHFKMKRERRPRDFRANIQSAAMLRLEMRNAGQAEQPHGRQTRTGHQNGHRMRSGLRGTSTLKRLPAGHSPLRNAESAAV